MQHLCRFNDVCFFIRTVNCQSCFNVQFVCGDGNCLNHNNDNNRVCNGVSDCSDGSDEFQCGTGKNLFPG